jgi:hypothetical protein
MWLVLLRIALVVSLVLPPLNLRIEREVVPMAVEYISSESVEQTAANDDSFSVTVPALCTYILVNVSGYYGSGTDPVFDQLNFDNGNDLDFTHIVTGCYEDTPPTYAQMSAFGMTATDGDWPGTGSKTLYFRVDGGTNPGEGLQIHVSYWKGVDQSSPVVDSEWRAHSSSYYTSSLTGVSTGDMGVIASYAYNGTIDVDLPGKGQTAIAESAVYRSAGFSIGYEAEEDALDAESSVNFVPIAYALKAAAAGGTTVDCTGAGAVAITGLAATISAGTTIACTTGAVAITGAAATVSAGTTIDCSTGAVAITGAAATVSAGTTIASTTGTIAITGLQATIGAGTTIDCSTGAVAIASNAATISAGTTVAATTGAIAITGLQASIIAGSGISCTTGAIGITGLAATVSAGTTIATSTGAIAIAGLQAEVDVSGGTTVDCSTGQIAITGLQATISAGKTIDTTTGAIAITGNQAAIWQGSTIDCTGAGALAIAGYGADVIAAIVVECSTGAVVITGNQAQVVSAETAVGRVTASSSGAKPGTTITGAKPRITITT